MTSMVLGYDHSSSSPVAVTSAGLRRGVYIVGKSGTGKSVTIKNLALGIMEAGEGLISIEPHGDLTRELLALVPPRRLDDVVYLDATDEERAFGLNLFDCVDPDNPLRVSETMEFVIALFEKAWEKQGGLGMRNAQYLRACARPLIINRLTIAELPELFFNESFRERMLASPGIGRDTLRFWDEYSSLSKTERERRRESTLDRIDPFLANDYIRHIVGQETTVEFDELMDSSRLTFFRLPQAKLNDPGVALLGTLVMARVLGAASARDVLAEDDRTPVTIFADEYQRMASPDFASLLDEARKNNVRTVVAHQRRQQLDAKHRDAPFGAGVVICTGAVPEDAHEIAGLFDLTNPPKEVYGERAVKVVPPEPFKVLLRQGHENRAIVQVANELQSRIMHLQELVWSTATHYGDSQGDLQAARDRLDAAIDATLYHWMTFRHSNFKNLWAKVRPGYSDEYVDLIIQRIHAARKSGDTVQEERLELRYSFDCSAISQAAVRFVLTFLKGRAPGYHNRNCSHISSDDMTGAFRALMLASERLEEMLRADPIRVNSGSYEPEYRSISTTEYRNQIAARLAALPTRVDTDPPQLFAAVKLATGEHTIRIHLPRRVRFDPAVSEEMIQHSRSYYRTRHAIEASIETRLVPSVTEESWERYVAAQQGKAKPSEKAKEAPKSSGLKRPGRH